MTALAGFEPEAEVTADDRARIPLGKAGVHRNDRYAVSRSKSGEILLTPLASIPRRELIVWENGNLRAAILRGLADVAEGKVSKLDWAEFADDE